MNIFPPPLSTSGGPPTRSCRCTTGTPTTVLIAYDWDLTHNIPNVHGYLTPTGDVNSLDGWKHSQGWFAREPIDDAQNKVLRGTLNHSFSDNWQMRLAGYFYRQTVLGSYTVSSTANYLANTVSGIFN